MIISILIPSIRKSGWPSGLRRQTQEIYSSLLWSEHSGPRMRAWVRIPLLTQTFCFSYKITAFSNAQALFRSLFMLLPTSNAIFIYVINFLTLWIHWMIFEWMNFEQKSPSEMNGIQTKIEWFRNILKKIYTKKKICRKTEKASSKFALLHKSRVSLHRSPMRTEAICIVCSLLCLSISTYLNIGSATSLTTTNAPYLIFRQTKTGRIERRALAFPFFLATVFSGRRSNQHQRAGPG